ncbi:EamA family transporter [Paracoccus sp. S-4012]|nr:DMT family transporter [Paracoccus sp. S-4012]MRX50881.1 EamA family transporter [Paracoccus sp. S-4012]
MTWVIASLLASLTQTARNAAQRGLVSEAGTMGATAVRFVFGLPFALIFLAVIALLTGAPPVPAPEVWGWAVLGAAAQIGGTALMLRSMEVQGFGVATALIKTEPASLALLAAVFVAEPLGPLRLAAIALAVAGVLLASGTEWRRASRAAILIGVASGALFGLSALAFRAGIVALPSGSALIRASLMLCLTLGLQAAAFGFWFLHPGRAAFAAIRLRLRDSFSAGFLGAAASQLWFLAFALTPAANVRTLALIEVPLAAVVSRRMFAETMTARQLIGMGLIVAGIALLLRTV